MAAVHEVVQIIDPIKAPMLDWPLEGRDSAGEVVTDGDEDIDTQMEEILQRLKKAAGAEAAMNGIISESLWSIATGRSKCRFEPR